MAVSNWTFVGVAYGAVWVAIGAYWWHLHRVLRGARERYERASGPMDGRAS